MEEHLENIVKGLVGGVLSAYLILYGFRPATPYPEVISEVYENKFIIFVCLILNYYVYLWDTRLGILLFLSICAILFDYFVFILPNETIKSVENK